MNQKRDPIKLVDPSFVNPDDRWLPLRDHSWKDLLVGWGVPVEMKYLDGHLSASGDYYAPTSAYAAPEWVVKLIESPPHERYIIAAPKCCDGLRQAILGVLGSLE